MTEKEWTEYKTKIQALGSRMDLIGIRALCHRLENPQEALKIIHIAGTNGKGSILAMVSSALSACGYKTGRYSSPAVFDEREQFSVNGRPIGKKLFLEYAGRLRSVCEEMEAEGLSHPTLFEFETALAFLYFKEQKCHTVVLETGMGGETDATNLITAPMIAAFASISMDHMAFLGDTLEQIATVKAGIIKEGCHVVSVSQDPEAEAVLIREAAKKHAKLHLAEEPKVLSAGSKGIRFSYKGHKDIRLSLRGLYQAANGAAALEILDCLQEHFGYVLPDERIRKSLEQLTWPGRFEQIAKKPDFYIDGAHNEAAAKVLSQTIRFYFTNKKIIYIMGVLQDKEYQKIILETYIHADNIIAIKPPHNARAKDAYELAKEAALYHNRVTSADSLEEAVEMANLLAGRDGIIVAFGSLSYLGALKKIVDNGKWTRRDSHGK
ncbi:MAG: bifunctional folylpolyglutamate synthase/dihydrofolate synthase [Lachnospiraceae bacterium]|nr:bifunctional folylpolyglutamate synthase/dihydrofolate synthase [Lachnospiraceae bacterium]